MHATETIKLSVATAVPADATAIAVNLTVVNGSAASFLTVWPDGVDKPWASSINWSSPAAVANSAVVKLGVNSSIDVFNNAGSVDVVIDLVGYYLPSVAVGGPTVSSSGTDGAQGPAGPAGAAGPTGPSGTTGPVGPTGATGATGAKGDTGTAGAQGIPGATGAPGAQGIPGATGPTGPAGPVGAKGDRGDTGATGAQGAKGDRGSDGTSVLNGPANPPLQTEAAIGDIYINTTTGDMFTKDATGWTPAGSTKGPQGDTGATGPAGATGATGDKGDKGDTGATGPAGATGDKGETGANGPAGATGATGDKGDTGTQGPIGATGPQGPTGATGPAGAAGSKINAGAATPADTAGADGDLFFNTTNSTIYLKASGIWTSQGSIKGDAGATGATGPQGAQGPTGATGAAGAAGATGAAGVSGYQVVLGPTVTIKPGTSGSNSPYGSSQANCPTGKVATGGGFNSTHASDTFPAEESGSYPVINGAPSIATGWKAEAYAWSSTGNITITAYVICATAS